jgi:hypothetical protein
LSDVEWSRKHREYVASTNDFFLELSQKIAKHPTIFVNRQKEKDKILADKGLDESMPRLAL